MALFADRIRGVKSMKAKEYFIDISNQPMAYHVQVANGYWDDDEGHYMYAITCVEATSDGKVYVVLQESDISKEVSVCLFDMIADDIDSGYYDEYIEPDGVEL